MNKQTSKTMSNSFRKLYSLSIIFARSSDGRSELVAYSFGQPLPPERHMLKGIILLLPKCVSQLPQV